MKPKRKGTLRHEHKKSTQTSKEKQREKKEEEERKKTSPLKKVTFLISMVLSYVDEEAREKPEWKAHEKPYSPERLTPYVGQLIRNSVPYMYKVVRVQHAKHSDLLAITIELSSSSASPEDRKEFRLENVNKELTENYGDAMADTWGEADISLDDNGKQIKKEMPTQYYELIYEYIGIQIGRGQKRQTLPPVRS